MSAEPPPPQDPAGWPRACDLVQDLRAIEAAAVTWRRAHMTADGPDPAGVWQAFDWWNTGRASRACAWRCTLIVGARLEVRHCCHPTALWPYYVPGLPELGTFRRLNQAQACAEAVVLPQLLNLGRL